MKKQTPYLNFGFSAFLLLLLLLTGFLATSQTVDSLQQAPVLSAPNAASLTPSYTEPAQDDLFMPGAFALLFIAGFFFVFAGIGAMLTLLFVLGIAGLVSVGMLSASILVGIHQKSFERGFRTLVILFSGSGGLVLGAVSLFIANEFFHWWTTKSALLIGSGSGVFAGLGLGFLALLILKRLTDFLKQRFQFLSYSKQTLS
ncbi:hypothetical protein [Tellurirhabdus bombi]|uniref:hypothetical protein n=1 Tax=Tellurirhabdus bombi TaxID=2907205 RepID=UPI001F1AE3A7|nr:hypothetical protein [Tellurirhabdus bombi]